MSDPLDRRALKAHYELSLPGYEEDLDTLHRSIEARLESRGFRPTMKRRVKRFDAYYEKLCRLKSGDATEPAPIITDLLGLRVVCPFLEDIEMVERLLTSEFDVVEVERKGEQHSFREFGYDSVHLSIRYVDTAVSHPLSATARICEVQLRTILQEAWAEVEHELVYKSDLLLPNESIRRKLASLNAILTLSDLTFQEIRDFQRELREQGHRRKAALQRTLEVFDFIAIAHPLEEEPAPEPRPNPTSRVLANKLERLLLLALEAHSNGDLHEAVDLYGQLLDMDPDTLVRAVVYNHRGMALFAQGDFRRALRDFTLAIENEPKNARSWANRALCHRVLERHDEALQDFDRALEIEPTHADAWYGRAQTFCELQRYREALEDCEQTLEIDPDHRAARTLAGLLRRNLG